MTENKRKLYILMANSFILYVLAYLVVLIPSQLITHLVASGFDIPTKFSLFKIIFPIPDHSYLWQPNSVAAIYIATPVFVLLLAIFIARYYVLFSSKNGINTNLFLIWIYAHCINIFFGGLTIGIPLIKGFGYVPHWLYASQELTFVFLLFSLLILFGNGYLLKAPFSALFYDKKFSNSPFHSFIFKIFVVFVPFIIANILFALFHFPDGTIYERLVGFTMVIQLIGVLPFSPIYMPEDYVVKKVHFSYKSVLILVLVFLSFVIWRIIHNEFIYEYTEDQIQIELKK